jgi:hypothetical protein
MSILEKEIFDINNYNDTLDHDTNEILINFMELIQICILYLNNNLEINNILSKKIIICNGVNIINNIFSILLLYTKNLDLSLKYSKKSFFYFCEFICQIYDEDNLFSSIHEATKFVLKKTIYNINNDYKENKFKLNKEEIENYNNIKNFTININNILICIIENNYKLDKNNLEIKEELLRNNKLVIKIINTQNKNLLIQIYSKLYNVIFSNDMIIKNEIHKIMNKLLIYDKDKLINFNKNLNDEVSLELIKNNRFFNKFINQL